MVQDSIGELGRRRCCEQTVSSWSRTSPSPVSAFPSHQHPLSCCKTEGKREERKQLHTFQCKSLILVKEKEGEAHL